MEIHVTVQVSRDAALALHRQGPVTADAEGLLQTADELGVELKPMHYGASDPALITFFIVEVPDSETAEKVIARLRQCKAIAAAYVKPPDEEP